MEHYLKLRPLLQRFVDAVVETGSAAGAVRKLGRRTSDPCRRGYKLMRKPGVREAVVELRQQAIEDAGITREQIVLGVHDTIQRCLQARPVLDKKGKPVMGETPDGREGPLYVFDSAGAMRGWEFLGKWAGMLTEKHEHTGLNTDAATFAASMAAQVAAAGSPAEALAFYQQMMRGDAGAIAKARTPSTTRH